MRTSEALLWLHPELAELSATPFDLARSHPGAETLLAHEGEVRALPLEPRADLAGVWLLPLRSGGEAEIALARIQRASAAFRATPPIPFFTCSDADGARTTRLSSCWRGLLPGDAYPERTRHATRALLRLLFPQRALLFRTLEHFALSGIDLASQRARWQDPPAPAPQPRARVVVLEGIDGAGKSTHSSELRAYLERRGLSCGQLKIFRHGLFHRTVTDLARLGHGGRNLHLWRLERMIKAFDSLKFFHAQVAPVLERCDVVLFDRYVHTHHAAATGRLHHDPFTRELLSVYPRPARVYLLDLPAEAALVRIGARGERTIDENRFMLDRHRRALLAQAEREGFVVLDARRPFEENHAILRADLEGLLPAAGAG